MPYDYYLNWIEEDPCNRFMSTDQSETIQTVKVASFDEILREISVRRKFWSLKLQTS